MKLVDWPQPSFLLSTSCRGRFACLGSLFRESLRVFVQLVCLKTFPVTCSVCVAVPVIFCPGESFLFHQALVECRLHNSYGTLSANTFFQKIDVEGSSRCASIMIGGRNTNFFFSSTKIAAPFWKLADDYDPKQFTTRTVWA